MNQPTLADLITQATKDLHAAGIQNGRSEAELIAAFALNEDKSYIIAHNDFRPSLTQVDRIQNLFNQRISRVPMSYVLGRREFYARNFKVDERALTPRIETEVIIQQAAPRALKNGYTLDMGTGCGALAVSLKLERPDLIVTGSDVSAQALDLAKENASDLLTSANDVKFVTSDLFSNLSDSYDLIVANLPYVSREADLMPEVNKEPDVALFGGDGDGLDLYRKFFEELPVHLNPQGYVYIESDPWQQPALTKLAAAAELQPIFSDYFILGFQYIVPTD